MTFGTPENNTTEIVKINSLSEKKDANVTNAEKFAEITALPEDPVDFIKIKEDFFDPISDANGTLAAQNREAKFELFGNLQTSKLLRKERDYLTPLDFLNGKYDKFPEGQSEPEHSNGKPGTKPGKEEYPAITDNDNIPTDINGNRILPDVDDGNISTALPESGSGTPEDGAGESGNGNTKGEKGSGGDDETGPLMGKD